MRSKVWMVIGFLLATSEVSHGLGQTHPFTRITTGPLVTAGGNTIGMAWGDYDGDGRPDLFVANYGEPSTLFRNLGNGQFEINAENPALAASASAPAWGDFDNDGDLDLFVGDASGNRLYRNDGGKFVEVVTFPKDTTGQNIPPFAGSATWVDYDNDGLLDIFVSNAGGTELGNEFLYHNEGQGAFTLVTTGPLVNSGGASLGSSFGDLDGDGWLDVVVPNASGVNHLYHNDGQGNFLEMSDSVVENDVAYSDGSAWGDYDNDGDLDLFVSNGGNVDSYLYRNDNGKFVRITNTPLTHDRGYSLGSVWADYDNDGFLDLVVANRLGPAFLYHNNGDGSFTRAQEGEIATTYTDANSVTWVDYDGDGFVDLVIGNWSGEGGPNNEMIYHNDGNTNAWLKVRLVGTNSNKSGIGAKVHLTARIRGQERTLLRQIGGFDSNGGTTLDAMFGLGDAVEVARVLVEWPSGIRQTLTGVGVKQVLEIVEPPVNPAVTLLFDPPSGFFTNRVSVSIIPSDSLVVHYTVDGSNPTLTSPIYSKPVLFTEGATLKGRAFIGQKPTSEVFSANYTRIYAYDGDGIPRAWREQYFGNNFPATDPKVGATADPDGDGSTNLQEYIARTNPVDATSVLKARLRVVPQIKWESVPGVTYQIYRHNSLQLTEKVKVGNSFRADATQASVVDPEAPDIFSFYTIEALPEP